ncbi:MAG: tryptophan--tRNA ligase [Candidatus Moranbacteria bacterium CG_4_10_14_3_um_filter_45_9]|nr:MAG: tryptophan--tRNA ligase [Candidatus Moranbacteria bacterium CG2_30_45_14]PIX90360.1 MAG: tryptophan--tRNA ligase [Candidatus Moranbacteria bacterium CG_4_10_14_3_um_filter_45_9]PJA85140.1 MAG: tryptophan--tRNA ligase [Candidatus Moranbacteria bacterium CG_4_9_14_3_um_filter_45_14]
MQKRLFSGIQPSGNLHLGNYLGAIKQWIELQNEYEAFFCVVDLHAITVPQDPVELRKKTLEIAKIYLASGISPQGGSASGGDPGKPTLFVQSHIQEHTELAWILNTLARLGDLEKMTQFKDKAKLVEKKSGLGEMARKIKEGTFSTEEYKKEQIESVVLDYFNNENKENTNVSLFDYPVLMAADILLYDTNVVPVGKDQMQHIELTRILAERFNKRFGETFVIPEGKLSKEGALIMGLDDPTKKMSKSAPSEYNYIALSDTADTVRKKIKKAVTDSGSEIVYSDEKPALKNLINIYSLLSDKTSEAIVGEYVGKQYSDFKTDLAEVIIGFLTPFQDRLKNISDGDVLAILESGAEKARGLARIKMKQVREKIGLLT